MSSISVARQLPGADILASLLQPVALFLSGALLIFVVGFAPMDAIHNAAHDTRHSAAFPCH